MNKTVILLFCLLPLVAFSDAWLVDGQSVNPLVVSSGSATNLDHDASNDTDIVNYRTATNLIHTRLLYARALPATNGIVWVDVASGYQQMHTATSNVTILLAARGDTNIYESFHLHVLADLYALSFATNHLDATSVAALNVSSNTFFSFRLVGPAGSDRWFVTENHDSLYVPPDLSHVAAGLSNGLIFYGQFDGSAQDLSGIQVLRGTNTTDGSAIAYTNGILGSAAVFAATNRTYFSYTNSPDPSLAPFCTNATGFTVSYWEYKRDMEGDFIDVILSGVFSGPGPFHDNLGFDFPNNDHVMYFTHYVDDEYLVGRGGSSGSWWPDYTSPADAWVLMTFVFDPSGLADLFINGQFYESASHALGYQPTGHFLIGNYLEYSHWTYNGYLDEVAMWNRTLSALEIQALYNNGAGRNLLP